MSRLYAELERAIRDAEFAEHAFNLAQRAAKSDRAQAMGLALALIGALGGDLQLAFPE
ncbi:hypothetical protein [Intrasporangium mesophilum]